MLELDRSAAEDREKRLLNRCDHLTRKVEELTHEMTAFQSAQDDSNGGQRRQGSPSVQKSSQKKQKRVAASSPGAPVPVAGYPQKELVRYSVESCSSVVRSEQVTSVSEASRVHQMDPDTPTDAKLDKQGLFQNAPYFRRGCRRQQIMAAGLHQEAKRKEGCSVSGQPPEGLRCIYPLSIRITKGARGWREGANP